MSQGGEGRDKGDHSHSKLRLLACYSQAGQLRPLASHWLLSLWLLSHWLLFSQSCEICSSPGVEYQRPLSAHWSATAGVNAQRTICIDDHGVRLLRDSYGHPLTASGRHDDSVITSSLSTSYRCEGGRAGMCGRYRACSRGSFADVGESWTHGQGVLVKCWESGLGCVGGSDCACVITTATGFATVL